ncbi:MAG: NigD-like C-terminal domain-containing protein [Rikenellaceae bacterium]
MKHHFLLTALLCLFTLSSCSLDDDYVEPGTYPDRSLYATINITPNLEDEDEEEYIFVTDSGQKLFLSDNKLTGDYEFEDQKRIIIYFALIEDYDAEGAEALKGAAYDCEYGLRLFGIQEVKSSETVIINTQEENEALADHAISYIYDSINYSYNHINMLAGLRADKIDEVGIYLVENLAVEAEEQKENYLNLELRYDRGTDEAMGSTYERYVSLNLDQFAERLESMDGIILRARTLNGGTIYVTLDNAKDSKAVSRSTDNLQL